MEAGESRRDPEQLPATGFHALCSSTHRFFDSQHQSWKLQHELPTDSISSGCGLCPDEVLKGSLCKRVLFWRWGAERTDKTPVRRARLSVVRSGDEQMPASWRHGSADAQLIGNWGFKFLLKFSISKFFEITKTGRWNTPINMATCWRCNQNNSWSEYKIKVTQDKGKTKQNEKNRGN